MVHLANVGRDPAEPARATREYVYLQQHNAIVGKIWQQHHGSFADLVASFSPKHVLEIGGGHGYLAMKLLFSGKVDKWTMVDPNPLGIFAMPQITIIEKFFEDLSNNEIPQTVDMVVHSHTLEHIYNHRRFFPKIATVMPIGSHHLFAIPNLMALMEVGRRGSAAGNLSPSAGVVLPQTAGVVLSQTAGVALLERAGQRARSPRRARVIVAPEVGEQRAAGASASELIPCRLPSLRRVARSGCLKVDAPCLHFEHTALIR